MAGGISFAQGITETFPTMSQISGTLPANQGGSGLTTIGTNQVAVGNVGASFTAAVIPDRMIAYATALSLTASGDVALTMSNAANLGSYIIRRVTYGLPNSSALATIIAVATLRTAANGGGLAVTGALVVTGLSATTAYLDQAVTLASAISTSSQLYVQVTTAAGTAPPSQIYVIGDVLGV